jgi:CrcB protein
MLRLAHRYMRPVAAGDPGTIGVEMAPFLVISLGGILGANARYLVSLYVAERFGTAFPYGTFLINVTGSVAIGFFLTLASERLPIDPLWRLFFATGFLGAYTTFSAYTYEAALLLRAGEYGSALVYLVGSVVVGMLGVFAGILAAERL